MTTVEGLLHSVRDALVRTSRSLFVDDPGFAASLRIGQIVKGRVLRHYEGGRYLMDFGGNERVVDSTMSLRPSELLTARVVGVGDQVHLQRLVADGDAATELAATVQAPHRGGPRQQLVRALFEQYNATLSVPELEALVQSVQRAPNPALMGLSGLVLSKIGIPLAPELLQALYRRLDTASAPPKAAPDAGVRRLVADPTAPLEIGESSLEPLAAQIRTLAHADGDERSLSRPAVGYGEGEADGGEASFFADDGGSDGASDRQWLLGQWLLNAQSHPLIAHRLVRIPLWLGDRLVEVSVALFSESESEPPVGGIQFGRAVLFLELDRLGRIQVTLSAAGQSLRVAVAAEDEAAGAALARYVAPLRDGLGGLGWQVAEVQYLQTEFSAEGAVLDGIVHHHITQDSLSRWM